LELSILKIEKTGLNVLLRTSWQNNAGERGVEAIRTRTPVPLKQEKSGNSG